MYDHDLFRTFGRALAVALIAGVGMVTCGQRTLAQTPDAPAPAMPAMPSIDPADYTPITLAKLEQAYLRLADVSIDTDANADEYSRVAYCQLYLKQYANDFEWHRVRLALRDVVAAQKDTFPLRFSVSGWIALGRYDFNQGGFELKKADQLAHIGIMVLGVNDRSGCTVPAPTTFPSEMRAALVKPLNLDVIAAPQELAAQAEKYWQSAGNMDLRSIPVVYMLSLTGIGKETYKPTGKLVDFSAILDRVDFYYDSDKNSLLYSYIPTPPEAIPTAPMIMPQVQLPGKKQP